MNSEENQKRPSSVGDLLALKLQQLHSEKKLKGDQALFRVDYRKEAAKAPFQFDTARAKLHRRGCRAIPAGSETALFGLWRMRPEERRYACSKCRPAPETDTTMDQNFTSDLFYGVVSILDQFGNVLRERGREYRGTTNGEETELSVEGLYANLGDREKEVLDVILSSLDGVLKTVHDLDRNLGGGNGSQSNHGNNGDEAGSK